MSATADDPSPDPEPDDVITAEEQAAKTTRAEPPSENKPVEKEQTSSDYAKEPTLWQQQVGALCFVCFGHQEVSTLTAEQKGQLMSEAKTIFKTNNYALDELRTWYTDEWKTHWPGSKGDRPTPSKVRSSIAAVRAAVEAEKQERRTYTPVMPYQKEALRQYAVGD